MSDQHPTAADVLREHYQNSTTWERGQRTTGWRCTCGQRGPGDHRDHMADMLAAAGLLIDGPSTLATEAAHAAMCDREAAHDAAVRAQALRDAADEVHTESRWAAESAIRRRFYDPVTRLVMIENTLRARADQQI